MGVWGEAIGVKDIPNPMLQPELCGRQGVDHSAICDPNNLIDKEEKDVIEGIINNIDTKIAEYAVAIVPKMKIGMFSNVENSAESYARTLHDEWQVGDKDLQNGVLIFISVDDRITYISRGKGLNAKLTDSNLDMVIEHMRKYLRTRQFGKAIEAAILETKEIASGVVVPTKESHLETYVVLSIFAAVIGYGFWSHHVESEKLASYRKGQAALSRLTRDVKNLENEKYSCTSCPICLEEFDTSCLGKEVEEVVSSSKDSKEREEKPMLPQHRPVSLKCGHIMCHSCLDQYFKGPTDSSRCPICRENIDPANSQPTTNNSNSNNSSDTPTPQQSNSTYNSSWTYSRGYYPHCCSGFNSNAELIYRLNRMQFLYPRVMTPQLHSSMTSAVQSGSQREFMAAAAARELEVGTVISDIVQRRAAHAAGSKGSSRSSGSFGGGRSSGGRGGRW